MLACDALADAHFVAHVDGVHGQVEQQVLLLGWVGDAAEHVGLDFVLRAGCLPEAELVQPCAPELVGARVSELQRAEGAQPVVGGAGDATLACAVDVGCHLVLVDDDGHVDPLACLEGASEHHTVARRGVPAGIELSAVVGVEQEGAPARTQLVHVAAVEVRAHPELKRGLSEGLRDSRGDGHAALLEDEHVVVVGHRRQHHHRVAAGALLQVLPAGIHGTDGIGVAAQGIGAERRLPCGQLGQQRGAFVQAVAL